MELGRITLSGPARQLSEHEVLRRAYLGTRERAAS
jgi:ABC-type branched-subunit amino acid transport system ATPase component